MKKFIIFFICVPLVYSELHRFMTTYTGISGQTAAGTPEFSAVTTLDDHQIDYYDSNIKKLIPRQDWMKEFASTPMWKEDTEIREKQRQIYRNNIRVLMERFTQSQGVHVYQRMSGCEYDNETGDSRGFNEYGYDGEDFISLDLKEDRYITHVPQGLPTVMKWNNNRAQLKYLKKYYDHECVYWLKEFLHLYKATTEKTELPKVSLLRKKQDYYTCHVTGFLYRNTSISWRKNGQANHTSNLIYGDTLPNGDGTFQRRLTLFIRPDGWKKDRFTCVVEHKSWAYPIQKSMTVNKIKKKPGSAFDASSIMYLTLVIITAIVVLIVIWKICKKPKDYYKKKTPIYGKSKPSQEQAPAQKPLLSNPSIEDKKTPIYGKSKPSQEQAPAQDSLLFTPSIEVPRRRTDLPNPSRQLSPLPIQKSMTVNETKMSNYKKKTPTNDKSKPSQEQAAAQVSQDPLLPTPSNEDKKMPTNDKSKPSQEQAAAQVSQDPLLSTPSIEVARRRTDLPNPSRQLSPFVKSKDSFA